VSLVAEVVLDRPGQFELHGRGLLHEIRRAFEEFRATIPFGS